MEELDEFGIPIKKTAKPSVSVDEFGIPIKKKRFFYWYCNSNEVGFGTSYWFFGWQRIS